MQRSFARFNLRAHFLNERRLLFELRRQRVNPFFLFLDLAVLLEQRRIHRNSFANLALAADDVLISR